MVELAGIQLNFTIIYSEIWISVYSFELTSFQMLKTTNIIKINQHETATGSINTHLPKTTRNFCCQAELILILSKETVTTDIKGCLRNWYKELVIGIELKFFGEWFFILLLHSMFIQSLVWYYFMTKIYIIFSFFFIKTYIVTY